MSGSQGTTVEVHRERLEQILSNYGRFTLNGLDLGAALVGLLWIIAGVAFRNQEPIAAQVLLAFSIPILTAYFALAQRRRAPTSPASDSQTGEWFSVVLFGALAFLSLCDLLTSASEGLAILPLTLLWVLCIATAGLLLWEYRRSWEILRTFLAALCLSAIASGSRSVSWIHEWLPVFGGAYIALGLYAHLRYRNIKHRLAVLNLPRE
jgi:hypothetical protein